MSESDNLRCIWVVMVFEMRERKISGQGGFGREAPHVHLYRFLESSGSRLSLALAMSQWSSVGTMQSSGRGGPY